MVLKVLDGLLGQITGDLALGEKVRTLQTQSRVAAWASLVIPYALLVFLCASTPSFRQFYDSPLGLVIVIVGGCASVAGFAIVRRLGRPIATTERVFTGQGPTSGTGGGGGGEGPMSATAGGVVRGGGRGCVGVAADPSPAGAGPADRPVHRGGPGPTGGEGRLAAPADGGGRGGPPGAGPAGHRGVALGEPGATGGRHGDAGVAVAPSRLADDGPGLPPPPSALGARRPDRVRGAWARWSAPRCWCWYSWCWGWWAAPGACPTSCAA